MKNKTMRNVANREHFEKMLIGSLIESPDQFRKIQHLITKDSFSSAQCSSVWEVIEALFRQRTPIDRTVIANSLTDNETIIYLSSIEQSFPFQPDVYARELHSIKTALELKENTNFAAAKFDNILIPIDEIASDFLLAANSYMEAQVDDEPCDYDSLVNTFMDYFDSDEATGIPSGIRILDKYIGGLEKDQIIILAARPSVGKSAFALQVGSHAADRGYPTAVFSLEMGKKDLAMRITAQTYKVDMERLKNREPDVAKELSRKIAERPRNSKNRPLFTREKLFDLYDISTQLRIWKKKENIELAIIDYVGLVETRKSGQSFKSIYERVSFVSREFKKLAKELNIPIILLCQMSREIEKEKRFPMLSDLRDSGSLEQDADMVIFIHKDEDGRYYFVISKNRQGKIGIIDRIDFNGPHQTFFETDRRYEGDL